MNNGCSIWIGVDAREDSALAVARQSIHNHLKAPIPIYGLILRDVQRMGLYTRPTSRTINAEGRLEIVDELSIRPGYDGRMSTEFAISRFLVPVLARRLLKDLGKPAWALFMDCDMMARADLGAVFDLADDKFAVMCVKHRHEPMSDQKMDGQVQTRYARKNWSSFCLFNLTHPGNANLTPELVNTAPGRDLHRFCWLDDDQIGELPPEWNVLVGETATKAEPRVVHWTSGGPWMTGYEGAAFSDEWRHLHHLWARGALSLPG